MLKYQEKLFKTWHYTFEFFQTYPLILLGLRVRKGQKWAESFKLEFDDAFYATGRLLRILSNSESSLSQLLKDVPHYYSTAETRVPCPDEQKFIAVERLVEFFRQCYDVVDVDGARVLFGDGWGLVRASNTQPSWWHVAKPRRGRVWSESAGF